MAARPWHVYLIECNDGSVYTGVAVDVAARYVDLKPAGGARFKALCSFLVDNGSDGVVVAGTTGEAPTLSDDERLAIIAAAQAGEIKGLVIHADNPLLNAPGTAATTSIRRRTFCVVPITAIVALA